MDTRRLKAFIEVVDAGSITRAAKALHIAQPALTLQVNELERQFKSQLLVRSSRGVTMTPAGSRLYRHAQTILRQIEMAREDVTQALDGIVHIGSVGGIEAVALVPLLKRAAADHPSIKIRLEAEMSGEIANKVLSHYWDIGLDFGDQPVKGIRVEPVLVEKFYLATTQDGFALPPGGAETALGQMPLLLPGLGIAHRKLIDQIFASKSLRPNIVAEINSLVGLTSAAAAGLGAAIVPAVATITHGAGISNTMGLHFHEIPGFERTLSICTADHALPTTAQQVRDLLVDVLKGLVSSGAWPGTRLVGPTERRA